MRRAGDGGPGGHGRPGSGAGVVASALVRPDPTELPTSLSSELERCARPTATRALLDRLGEADAEFGAALGAEEALAVIVVRVVAASRSLGLLLERDPAARTQLRHLDRRSEVDATSATSLAAWKRRELLRIAARDLGGIDDLTGTTESLARLAVDVLEGACHLHGAGPLAVIGMGKLGGRELNYASDVDVMFVGDGPPRETERMARSVMDTARQCFRIDANLRPEGRNGPLVRTLDGFEAYWDRWARPWEFQALLKARPVAGDAVLGGRFLDTAQRWLWNRPFSTDDLREVRHLKERAEDDVARKGLEGREIKRGRGGIRDIEFTAQLLQLVHGHADPGLRSPTTLVTLAELGAAGYMAADDSERLADAYRFLRTVEHRLQLVEEQQTHTVPDDPSALDALARVLGYRDRPEGDASACFDHDLRRHRLAVRSIHERVYFRPLLEAFATADASRDGSADGMASRLDAAAVEARLTAFGFTDTKRTAAAVRELTRGLTRSSRLMQQFLPLILDWLSASPDPDLGLLMLRNLLGGARRNEILEAFRESPEAARRVCLIVGSSRLVGDGIARNPDLVERLPSTERLRTQPRRALVESAATAASWRSDPADRQAALKRWHERHLVGIAARDLLGLADVETVGANLAAVAEGLLEVALSGLEPALPFAVLGLGRFGGSSLSYASDLDLVFAYEGSGPADAAEANRIATGLLRFVGGGAGLDRIWEVDADLRPEGRQGAMARSVEGFRAYFERWALVWERQAFLRARPVAGDEALGARLLEALEPSIWGEGLGAEDVREIRRMKARIERERIPAGEDPAFHLKLGRGSLSDVEFTAQLLQLIHGVRGTGTLEALTGLVGHGALSSADAEVLAESYRFCELARNRLFLIQSAPRNSLPNQPEQLLWLARSLGTDATELREHYRRVTRRARRVVERVFYGQG